MLHARKSVLMHGKSHSHNRRLSDIKRSRQIHTRKKEGRPDFFLMWTLGILVLFGLLALASASSVVSFQKYESTYRVLFHQIIVGLLPGTLLMYIFYKVNYHFWQRFNFLFLLATLVLLVSVFIPGLGSDFGTAQSWVSIFGISFQPSEIAKFTFILYLAGWFEKRGYVNVRNFTQGLIPFSFVLAIVLGLVAKQPDIGTMMIITFIAIMMFFVAGARISHLLTLGVLGSSALTLLMIKSLYIRQRLLAFLDPTSDPQNVGYHIGQAFLAVGSGGLIGRGFGKSVQKFSYLPEVSSDSIFAVIAEELGFLGAVFLVALFLVIAYRGLKIATQAPDPYGRMIATGIVSWLVFQAFLNIMVMTGLAPLTGIPFPFISSGGTALAISLAASGLLLNISKHMTR